MPTATVQRLHTTLNSRVTTYDPQLLIHAYIQFIERNEGLAHNTVISRRSLLNHYLGYLKYRGTDDIRTINILEVDEYIEQRQLELKPSSLGQLKTTLRGFFGYCELRRKINLGLDYTLIRRKRDKPAKVKTFTFDEIQAVIANADNAQDRLMIALLFESGIRIGELVKVSVDDINGTEIRVRGKGSYDRTVYITPDLARKLRLHVIETGVRSGPIFRHQINFYYLPTDTYSVGGARDRIKRQFMRKGITMHPHQLRHSFAINWLLSGGDLRTLQKILGHSSLEVTQRYLQLTDRYTEEAYARCITRSVLI